MDGFCGISRTMLSPLGSQSCSTKSNIAAFSRSTYSNALALPPFSTSFYSHLPSATISNTQVLQTTQAIFIYSQRRLRRSSSSSSCSTSSSSHLKPLSSQESFLSASISSVLPFCHPSEKVKSQRGRQGIVVSAAALPSSYDELISQAQTATEAALSDGKTLLEIEFPTASVDSVSGDAEGGIEMTRSVEFIRQFSRMFSYGTSKRITRIFFPDVKEVEAAKRGIFENSPFRLDYLTNPSGLEDIGFGKRVKMKERVASDDEIFLVAYPYFNVNEMLAVEELYKDVAEGSKKPIVVFNGELDRIRSGYYPAFFYPKLGALAKSFLPKFDTVFYIHNFKGRNGGKLFRAYPGDWEVWRSDRSGRWACIHRQESMPSLKEVALDILPHA